VESPEYNFRSFPLIVFCSWGLARRVYFNGETFMEEFWIFQNFHELPLYNLGGSPNKDWATWGYIQRERRLRDQIGSEGEHNSQFSCPNGICILDVSVYVCDRDNHCIQKFTLDGYYFDRKWGVQGNWDWQFQDPVCISCSDKAFVCYWHSCSGILTKWKMCEEIRDPKGRGTSNLQDSQYSCGAEKCQESADWYCSDCKVGLCNACNQKNS